MSTGLADKSYAFIRGKLMAGKLPPGSRIEEPALALEIGVSRVPVREAIRRLESEGLVGRLPRLGAFVPVATTRDVRDQLETREALECYAVARAAERATSAQLSDLKAIVAEMIAVAREILEAGLTRLSGPLGERFLLTDVAFHMAIMRMAGNRKAAKIVGDLRLMTHLIRYRDTGFTTMPYTLHATLRDHANIWRALRRCDGVAAASLMSTHIARAAKAILENLPDENLAEGLISDWPASHDQLIAAQQASRTDSLPARKSKSAKKKGSSNRKSSF